MTDASHKQTWPWERELGCYAVSLMHKASGLEVGGHGLGEKEIVRVLPHMRLRDSGKPSLRRPPYFHSKFDIELPEARQGEGGRSGPKDPVGGRPGANKQQDMKLFSP
ncbi:uncharacterized protein L3040_005628 [Drepanopeziza brunnea f. sp. 'multigermtubi']|uniref:uncharacterized protein n=1 Tax=Drepanopeziza brunnea f. sp. 'multigermtubi' TaxID=698441 RepID=UPI0023A4EDB0|nr:hypothetical protein L3040_005628 [Drepanopeziza brunnea f. sp. 'multigermtubi']